MQIEVVAGANYGDEGKGMFIEHLCRVMPKPIVILSNGGCQRGHTVNNVELGIRHVFHHFGSGTLLSVPSVYAKTFLLNPIKYAEEKRELEQCGIKPIAFRAPGCILQLPGDMLANQALETSRKKAKHGSCGWGIWETIVRNTSFKKLTAEDFAAMPYAKKHAIVLEAFEWQLDIRLANCRSCIDSNVLNAVKSEGFIKHFIQDFEEMASSVKCIESDSIAEVDWKKHGIDVETVVVENAQGLLLDIAYAPKDENGNANVHTTPSRCGVAGALEALGDRIKAKDIAMNYVTRSYMTRHGAGPFPEEDNNVSFDDKTNMPNCWQGALRFGKIDDEAAEQLLSRTALDSKLCAKCNIIVTHCNEIEPYAWLKAKAHMLSYEDDSKMFKEK